MNDENLSEMLADEYKKRASMTPEELKKYDASISDDGIFTAEGHGSQGKNTKPDKGE